jgi:hypothetical protein
MPTKVKPTFSVASGAGGFVIRQNASGVVVETYSTINAPGTVGTLVGSTDTIDDSDRFRALVDSLFRNIKNS